MLTLSAIMQPPVARSRAGSWRGPSLAAALCAIGLGASAVPTAEAGLAAPQALVDAWWTGPLLAPSAATPVAAINMVF